MDKILRSVTGFFAAENIEAYLVGGAVRDKLIQKKLNYHDLDFVIKADALFYGEKIAKRLKASFFPLDKERGTGRVVVITKNKKTCTLDFTSLGKKSISEDLACRDFTIDAMAIAVGTNKLIDPFSGREDIKKKIIRPVHLNVLREDPLRLLRGIRLASLFKFNLHPSLKKFIKTNHSLILTVAGERVRDEIFKILNSSQSSFYLNELKKLNLIDTLFPELKSFARLKTHEDVKVNLWTHSLHTVYYCEHFFNDLENIFPKYYRRLQKYFNQEIELGITLFQLLKMAALFHDLGKPDTKSRDESGKVHFIGHEKVGSDFARKICLRLKLGKSATEIICNIIYFHMYPFHLSDNPVLSRRALYRFFRRTETVGPAVILLALSDARATPVSPAKRISESKRLKSFFNNMLKFYYQDFLKIKKTPLLTGKDLIHFGLIPGPQFGEILKKMEEDHSEHRFKNKKAVLKFLKTNYILNTPVLY